ncbi:MAG: Coenzyme F420 hydrogenase/dehydrogenase, beta subunit C-terminal domain [Methanobacteriota archaeon]
MKKIIKSDMCMLCGTCMVACPSGAIRKNGRGFPFIDESVCIDCGLCGRVCPGWGFDFASTEEREFSGGVHDPYLGQYLNVYLGHAMDEDLRSSASSGGIVTALLAHAFDSRLIDGALVVGFGEEDPLSQRAFIAESSEQLAASLQSKYSAVMVNEALKEAGKYSALAVVGKSCNIQGVRLLEAENPGLKKKIRFRVGIFCGFGHAEPRGLEFLLGKMNVKKEDVASLEYRGGGYPGGIVVTRRDGSKATLAKDEYKIWNPLFMLPRCLYCIDFAAELADVSVGDAFSLAPDGGGWSAAIVRSKLGSKLVRGAVKEGRIFLEEASADEIVDSQKFMTGFKKGALTRTRISGIDRDVSYNTITRGAHPSGALYTVKQLLIIGLYRFRDATISAFRVLPFPVFKTVSKMLRRS